MTTTPENNADMIYATNRVNHAKLTLKQAKTTGDKQAVAAAKQALAEAKQARFALTPAGKSRALAAALNAAKADEKTAKRALKQARKTGDSAAIDQAERDYRSAHGHLRAVKADNREDTKRLWSDLGKAINQIGDVAAGRDPAYEWTTVRADHPETKHRIGAGLAVWAAPGVGALPAAAVAATSRTTGEGHATRERKRALTRISMLQQQGWELVDTADYPARKGGYTEWTLRKPH